MTAHAASLPDTPVPYLPGAPDEPGVPAAHVAHVASTAREAPNPPYTDPASEVLDAAPWAAGDFSPAIAEALADLIVRYWQDCAAHAEIHRAKPIDVIDLAPGNGSNGHQLMRALASKTRQTSPVRCRYLPVVPDARWMAAAAAAPEMARWRQQGVLQPLLGRPGAPAQLTADGYPYQADNPVVILAHDGWSRLPQRLLAVHYGKLLEADLDLILQGGVATSERPDWRPIDPDAEPGLCRPLFTRYLDEFNSTPIPYPEGAIAAMRDWRRCARHGYLLLATGAGFASELSLRLCTFPQLVSAFREAGCLPVNFGLLVDWCRLHGVAARAQDLPEGHVLQMVMEAADSAGSRLAALAHGVDPAVFNRHKWLSQALRAPVSGRRLEYQRQLLQLSAHDPALFAELGREFAPGLAKAGDIERAAWRSTLAEIWTNFLPELNDHRLHQRIAHAAMHCGHWQLARQALLRGMRHHGETATDVANLAWCEMRTGKLRTGFELVQRALALESDHPLAQQVMKRISERLSQRDQGWRVELQHPQLPISVEPLDCSHAEAYFHQYRDPQIAIMTGLPPLGSVEETRQWILGAPEEKGRISFAVMHHDYGFVGYVNLSVSAHAAFFCFWTGVDFQGAGYATAASRLVFRHARTMGVPIMLTSAYKDNRRSIRALERLGFVRMASQAFPPDQDRVFFAMVDPSAGTVDAHQELLDYYKRESLPLAFAEPATGSAAATGESAL